MSKVVLGLTVAIFIMFSDPLSYAQQADAPVYKDGDWWKVKVEVAHTGFTQSGACHEAYPEYLVKIEQAKPKVYGVTGNKQEEINCPSVGTDLLDVGGEKREYLKFPLTVGKSWSFRWQSSFSGRWRSGDYSVLGWEKITTAAGEFDAFKLQQLVKGDPWVTYWYAPKAKAIILYKRRTQSIDRTVTLVDFNVSE